MVDINRANELIREIELLDARISLCADAIDLDAPADVFDELAARITAIRSEVVAALKSRCTRCGSFEFIDVPIHDGQSSRRDCEACNFTAGFTRWYEDDVVTEAAHFPPRTVRN